MYPAQEEAVLELISGSNVILNTPTGSGKSLVAVAAHFAALARDSAASTRPRSRRSCRRSSSSCADVRVRARRDDHRRRQRQRRRADHLLHRRDPRQLGAARRRGHADVDVVVMDEFHFYADPQRGWAWQIPLLELPRAQFLLMSATLGPTKFFQDDLTRRTGRPTARSRHRSARCRSTSSTARRPSTSRSKSCWQTGRAPIYLVHFTQARRDRAAQALSEPQRSPRTRRRPRRS
jgi:hypothetical protein